MRSDQSQVQRRAHMDFPAGTIRESSCTKTLPPEFQVTTILLTLMEIAQS